MINSLLFQESRLEKVDNTLNFIVMLVQKQRLMLMLALIWWMVFSAISTWVVMKLNQLNSSFCSHYWIKRVDNQSMYLECINCRTKSVGIEVTK